MAKQIADYCNTTFFDIMNRPAIEVIPMVLVIQAEIELNKK